MIQATKAIKADVMELHLSEPMETGSSLAVAVGAFPPGVKKVQVYCSRIPRINSEGIKDWVSYFQELTKKGIQLEFFECSPAIVGQMSAIVNFSAGGTIRSVMVPFACSKCTHEMMVAYSLDELRKLNFSFSDTYCSRCGEKAIFDEIPGEYFAFAQRMA